MSNLDRGKFYFIVEVTKDISRDGWISFAADDVTVSPNGDLIAMNHTVNQNEKYPGLIITRGKWLYCHAASMIDGDAITTDHWNFEERHNKNAERAKLNKSLRYDVLKRDNFTCMLCGRTQEDGAKLHVDHIKPIAKDGKTTISNLRTLCSDCNLGKGTKLEDMA